MIKTFFSSLRIIFYLFILVLVYVFYLSRDLPSLERLETFDPAMLSTLYDRNGEVIGEFYIQKRVFVDIEDMPNHLKNAAIASEDKRFYSHWGVDLQSFFRAVVVNVSSMSFRQGFSTLSQQLARNLYKEVGFKDSITRKLKEMITAIQIERTYTKNEILEMYLNTIHFGHGTYGVEAATKRFFGKSSTQLSIDESALLVGLLPSPANYSPINYPEISIRRRNTILRLMRDQNFIDREVYQKNRSKNLDSVQGQVKRGMAPYFTEYVRRTLEKIDEELLLDTIKKSQLENFINSLPNKLDTIVGERGARLSGGEKQRIGIARALYNKPKIMIFDEATSALDIYNENKILEEVFENKKDKTLIIISHRNNTVKYCDSIYVMEDGKIIDNGPFEEIIKKYSYLKESVVNN